MSIHHRSSAGDDGPDTPRSREHARHGEPDLATLVLDEFDYDPGDPYDDRPTERKPRTHGRTIELAGQEVPLQSVLLLAAVVLVVIIIGALAFLGGSGDDGQVRAADRIGPDPAQDEGSDVAVANPAVPDGSGESAGEDESPPADDVQGAASEDAASDDGASADAAEQGAPEDADADPAANAATSTTAGGPLGPPLPNLAIEGLGAAEGSVVRVVVRNSSTVDVADESSVVLLVDGVSVGSQVLSSLAAGESATFSFSASCGDESRSLVAVVDAGASVTEAQERDNSRTNLAAVPC